MSTSKVTLSQFTTPRTRRIASIANRCMRRHGTLVDGFPSSQQKESSAWDIMVDACKSNSLLTKRLTELEKDIDMKNMLVNYVSDHHFNETVLMIHLQTWQGMGSVRAEMIFKARQGVPSWYSLTDLEGGEEMRTVCKWLLKDNIFLHGDIDVKVSWQILDGWTLIFS
jgi:hypothetical protein